MRLWLAHRSGLFQPGSSTAEASGKRSALEIVPSFAGRVSPEASASAMAALYANAAFRRHLEARGASAHGCPGRRGGLSAAQGRSGSPASQSLRPPFSSHSTGRNDSSSERSPRRR